MLLFFKNLLFTVLVPGTVAVYLPLLIAQGNLQSSRLHFVLSLLVFLIGLIIYGWCLWDFASFGRGTPAPIDAPKKLVTHGLYQYSRNPMYLGVLTVILGWIVLFWNLALLAYGFVVWLVFHFFVVYYEEKLLQKEFGKKYQQYCGRVGRWFSLFGQSLAV